MTKNRSMPTMTMSVPPSTVPSRAGSPEEEDDDDDGSDDEAPRKNKRRRSSVGHDAPDMSSNTALISDDIRRQLDTIFDEFLNRVCSDLEYSDSKGEKLHQVLMPKKMQRLNESTDYRPFKFRIQAFTNAFQEELQSRGITEETMSVKKIKSYLWKQDLISRFNSDGKKAKSKGNHIWNVDAKKLPDGTWVFRPFKRRIINHPDAFVLPGQRWEWEPKIWDPQAASETIKPTFSSPPGNLPPWLSWEDGTKLVGTPEAPTDPLTIVAVAEFTDATGQTCTLDTSFTFQVVVPKMMANVDPRLMYPQGFSAFPPEFQDPAQIMLGNQIPMYAGMPQPVTGMQAYPQPAMQMPLQGLPPIQPMYNIPPGGPAGPPGAGAGGAPLS